MASAKLNFGSVEGVGRRDLPTSKSWRDACRKRLKRMDRRQHELADHIGASQAGVSQALSQKKPQERSELVERISAALGVDLPSVARAEIALMEIEEIDEDAALDKARDLERLARLMRPKNT